MPGENGRNLRHELRTPVNHLVGYADLLLEEGGLDPETTEALTNVRLAAQQSLSAIASIVDDTDDVDGEALGLLVESVAGISTAVARLQRLAGEAIGPDIDRLARASGRLVDLVGGLSGAASSAGQDSPAATREPTPGSGAVVLVVDDDEGNRDVLGRRLARLGYQVVEASNGVEALEALARADIDLVLLDLMMPVMDGFGVLERRQHDERLNRVPVVMISALDQVEHVARCIELGADDYLTKPFDPVLLKARVGACIEKKQLHDRQRELLARVTQQSAELRELNRDLERRVDEKVREVERLSLMQRFVSPELSQALAEGGIELLRSHRREIAVLFCDLRGFTSFAETAEPEDVMAVLGEFHAAVGPLIFAHQGTLTHFTGDGMMVVFNDPIPCDGPAAKAAALALAMRDSAEVLSSEWRRRGHALGLGVGLAMGFATCGQIGFDGRFEYTAIGTIPNLAARLCAEAGGGQVLANERIRAELGSGAAFGAPRELQLKGLARAVTAYEVEPLANETGA